VATRAYTVLQLIPALESGGAERSTLEIAAALIAGGHRALVVSAGGRLVAPLERLGAEHISLDIGRKSLATLRHIGALRRLMLARAVDIVHARSRLPAWLGWLATRGVGARRPRFVTTVHGLNSPGWYSAIMTRGERVICVSDNVRTHLTQHYPKLSPQRLRVIARGIDLAAFPRGHQPCAGFAETLHPALRQRPVLLLPARGTRLKGHAHGIELLARLAAIGIAASLWLLGADEAGRGDYLDELRALARARGVAERFVIEAARADIADCIAHADLVLQLSVKPESFGRTVIEAAGVGRPIVGYAHGGVGELLRELSPAGAVAPGDLDALTHVVAQQLRAPVTPVLPAAYALARMQSATLALYDELLSSSP
jgi:glycosyltransferase involved in cell wall biosynthesis